MRTIFRVWGLLIAVMGLFFQMADIADTRAIVYLLGLIAMGVGGILISQQRK